MEVEESTKLSELKEMIEE
jgi:UV excision repair protein RAD23